MIDSFFEFGITSCVELFGVSRFGVLSCDMIHEVVADLVPCFVILTLGQQWTRLTYKHMVRCVHVCEFGPVETSDARHEFSAGRHRANFGAVRTTICACALDFVLSCTRTSYNRSHCHAVGSSLGTLRGQSMQQMSGA